MPQSTHKATQTPPEEPGEVSLLQRDRSQLPQMAANTTKPASGQFWASYMAIANKVKKYDADASQCADWRLITRSTDCEPSYLVTP